MKNEFLIAITQLSAEKKLPKEVVFQVVEAALASAYRKDAFAGNPNVSVKISPQTGEVKVYVQKSVVAGVTNHLIEVSLTEAQLLQADVALGDSIVIEVTPANAGRIAAQTAKQVVLQRLREAEREIVFEEYVGKEGEVLSGVVQRIEPKQIIIDVGRTEAILPASEQVPVDRYRVGQRLKVYVLEVHRSNKGPQVVVSRTHKNLLRRLFELEVPEIFNGTVEVKAIAREPGQRSKVAVVSRQEGIDPVGSCVGLRGIRIQNIVNEIHGERVDVVLWDPDQATFVLNALSPAQVSRVLISEADKTATVVVPDRQLSLAIGREGQNARLAAKLTGWRVDIKSASTFAELQESEAAEAALAAAAEVTETAPTAEAVAPPTAEMAPPEAVVVEETISQEAEVPAMAEERKAPPVARAPWEEVVELIEGEELATIEAPLVEERAVAAEPTPALPTPSPTLAAPPRIRFAEEVMPGRGEDKTKQAKKGGKEEEEAKAKTKTKKARPRVRQEELEDGGVEEVWR